MSDLVTDQGPGSAGTTIGAAILDALVVAQSHVYNDTIPATSATLAQTFPSAEVVFNNNDNTGGKVAVASATLSLVASNDNYVDGTSAGAYVLAGSVAINAAPPVVAMGNMRLWKATTGASSVTAVTLLAPTQPLNVTQVQADLVEATTLDMLGPSSSLLSSLNRVRYVLQQITGAPAATMVSVLASLRQMVQLNPTSPQVGSISVTGTIATSGKVALSSSGSQWATSQSGGANIPVGNYQCGSVAVASGLADGTTWQLLTTLAQAGSVVQLTGSCGQNWNGGFIVSVLPGSGSFTVKLNTMDALALNAAGSFYWAIVS